MGYLCDGLVPTLIVFRILNTYKSGWNNHFRVHSDCLACKFELWLFHFHVSVFQWEQLLSLAHNLPVNSICKWHFWHWCLIEKTLRADGACRDVVPSSPQVYSSVRKAAILDVQAHLTYVVINVQCLESFLTTNNIRNISVS